MNIDQLIQLVGSQHIEILVLRKQLAELQNSLKTPPPEESTKEEAPKQ